MSEKLITPDMPLGGLSYRQLLMTIPANADMERFISGAISGIGFFTSWVQGGSMTPEEAAFIMKDVYNSMRYFDMLGTIQAVIRESLDSSMLLCDGSVYDKEDYQDLWDVWPSAMKDASTLTLPDLRNLFLVGATLDYSLGDTGGEAEVTLTEAQMPSHSHTNSPHGHTDGAAAPTVVTVGAGAPVPSAVPSAGLTSFDSISIDPTGGGEAHNNLPPYYAVVYAVIARVNG